MRLVLTIGLLCLLCVSQVILPCTAQPEQDSKTTDFDETQETSDNDFTSPLSESENTVSYYVDSESKAGTFEAPPTIPATEGTEDDKDNSEDDKDNSEDFLDDFIQNFRNIVHGVTRTLSQPSENDMQVLPGDDNTESNPAVSFFKALHFNDDESASSEEPEPQQSSLPLVRLTFRRFELPSTFNENASVEHEDSVVNHENSEDQISEELQEMFLGQQKITNPEDSVESTDMNQTILTAWPPKLQPTVDPLFAISNPMHESNDPAQWAHHLGRRRFRAWHFMRHHPLALIGLGAIVMAGFIGATALLVSLIKRKPHSPFLNTIAVARKV